MDDSKEVFNVYDKDKRGVILVSELKSIFADMGFSFVERPDMNEYFDSICKSTNRYKVN